MPKPKPNKTATFMGMEGTGPTVADAKANAMARAERFIREASNGPEMYVVHGMHCLIWADQSGMSYHLLESYQKHLNGYLPATCCMDGDWQRARAAAILHAVQYTWTAQVDDDEAFVRTGFAAMHNPPEQAISDEIERCAWRRRCLAAQNAGANANQAWEIAFKTDSIEKARGMAEAVAMPAPEPVA